MRRFDVKAILADPVKRRRLLVPAIQFVIGMGAGRDMSREAAERAYDAVQKEKRRVPSLRLGKMASNH